MKNKTIKLLFFLLMVGIFLASCYETITGTIVDSESGVTVKGNRAIAVNAVTTTPHVTLRANIESGISPLTTYFLVSTAIPNAVITDEMDFQGDGVVDYRGNSFENISITYTSEGIYHPTVRVTDTEAITYLDTIAIVVLNKAELDALLKAMWNGIRGADDVIFIKNKEGIWMILEF